MNSPCRIGFLRRARLKSLRDSGSLARVMAKAMTYQARSHGEERRQRGLLASSVGFALRRRDAVCRVSETLQNREWAKPARRLANPERTLGGRCGSALLPFSTLQRHPSLWRAAFEYRLRCGANFLGWLLLSDAGDRGWTQLSRFNPATARATTLSSSSIVPDTRRARNSRGLPFLNLRSGARDPDFTPTLG